MAQPPTLTPSEEVYIEVNQSNKSINVFQDLQLSAVAINVK